MKAARWAMADLFFFFNDTATTEIYTLSLHDALPICWWRFGRSAERTFPEHRARQRSVGHSSKTSPTRGLHPATKSGPSRAELSRAIIALARYVARADRSVARRLSGGE